MPPPNLPNAYAAALQGPPPGGPPGGGMPMPPPMPAAPPPVPQQAPMPVQPPDSLPMTQEGDVFFLDPAMLPDGKDCKEGDEIMLKARVGKPGSKIPCTPLEVVMEAENPEEEAGEDEGNEDRSDGAVMGS